MILLFAEVFTAVEQLSNRNLESVGDLKDVAQPGTAHAVLDALDGLDGFAVDLGDFSESFLAESSALPHVAQPHAEPPAQLSDARRDRVGNLPAAARMILQGLHRVQGRGPTGKAAPGCAHPARPAVPTGAIRRPVVYRALSAGYGPLAAW
ncbi:hypothetical protein [Streptosporangium minutum]|uniref:hypothetical protein n=1 Tax=Streptosporangium minutum TaxID=569862 RepID=UPI001F6219B7|nr:hypothetical protein [Streptosporangium minutum]